MAGKRFYDDGSEMAHALDLVGERWALHVVRELMFGPKRFTDLRNALAGISPNVLSQRLEDLEASAIVTRRTLPPPAAARVYELTAWGAELAPAIEALGRWGARSPAWPAAQPVSVAALVMSLRTLFEPERARWQNMTVELRLDGEIFTVIVARRQIDVEAGPAGRPDAVLEGSTKALASMLHQARPLDEAVAAGDVAIDGSRRAAEDFVTLFPVPSPPPGTAVPG